MPKPIPPGKLNNIFGTIEDDELFGTSLDDLIRGYDGNDLLEGSDGDDVLEGDDGNDVLDGGPGSDSVDGGDGDDTIRHFAATNEGETDTLDGGDGVDTLELYLTEDEWNDPLIQEELDDYKFVFLPSVLNQQGIAKNKPFQFEHLGDLKVSGFENLEIVVDGKQLTVVDTDPNGSPVTLDLSDSTIDQRIELTGDGDATIITGDGDDFIIGADGNYVIDAGDGENEITVGDGQNTITTGDDDDVITAGDGGNIIDAGDGDNTVVAGAGPDRIFTGSGDDVVTLGDGADFVDPGAGTNTVIAGLGGGDDVVDGTKGRTTVTYPSISTPLLIDLNLENREFHTTLGGSTVGALLVENGFSPTLPVGLAEGIDISSDVLIAVDDAIGGSGDDTFYGNENNNFLNGSAGYDRAIYAQSVLGFDIAITGMNLATVTDINQNDGLDGEDTLLKMEEVWFEPEGLAVYLDGRNNAPFAVRDTFATSEDGPSITFDPLANDRDFDGDLLTVTSLNTDNTLGAAVLNADGTITYSPNGQFEYLPAGAIETETLYYTVSDGTNESIGIASATIYGRNDVPTFTGIFTGVVTEDSSLVGESHEPTSLWSLISTYRYERPPREVAVVDLDSDESTFEPQVLEGSYGDFIFDYDPVWFDDPFVWQYQARNDQFQSLRTGEQLTDSVSLMSPDGSASQQITVTIRGIDDYNLDFYQAMGAIDSPSANWTVHSVNGTGASYQISPFLDGGGLRFSTSVALGDLDNDGDLDAFVGNGRVNAVRDFQAENQVMTNVDGVLTLAEGVIDSETSDPFANTSAVALADFDNDGWLDVYVANRGPASGGGEQNQVLMNRGADGFPGEFAAGFGTGIGGAQITTDVAIGDLDGDGDNDIFLTNLNEKNKVLINPGGDQSGVLSHFVVGIDPENSPSGANLSRGVALGDLDGDGDLDAFIVEDNALQVLINSGLNTADFDTGSIINGRGEKVALGDMDGDGDLDAVVSITVGPNGILNYYINQGNGEFEGEFGWSTSISAGANYTGGLFFDFALADLNSDEVADILVVHESIGPDGTDHDLVYTTLMSHDKDGDGHYQVHEFGFEKPGLEDGNLTTAIAFGDLNGDGDYAAVNDDGLPNLDPLGTGVLPDLIA